VVRTLAYRIGAWPHDQLSSSRYGEDLDIYHFLANLCETRSTMLLHVLPIELSLSVLSYLPLPTLCSLPALSRQWFNLFSANQSTIFHNAAVLHGYVQPETILLDDALSLYKGSPWDGATDWKDFCKRSDHLLREPWRLISASRGALLIFIGRRCFQLRTNWEGNGRVVPRLVTPPGSDIHRIKVDEKAGICITTRILGGLAVTHLFSGVLLWSLSPVRGQPSNHPLPPFHSHLATFRLGTQRVL